MGDRALLADLRGGVVYVVEFADRVKLGKASRARTRLRQHLADGARRAVVFPIPLTVPLTNPAPAIERAALARAAQCGRRIGNSESFRGLGFDVAVAIMTTALRTHGLSVDQQPVDLAALGVNAR